MKKIALVGDNGSGKSTLIKLLLGLYQPTQGTIRIDGLDLCDINVNEWRRKTTVIFQDFQKFNLLNVKDNIAVGQTDYIDDLDRIQQAATLSGAHDMVTNLSEGYHTLLGKEFGGTDLSHGQWQRIAIARTYMRNADLLILDEPTASLDAKGEVEIYNQFKQAANGKTVIFISHRLGVSKLADRIIVLKNGHIVEDGSHSELMENNGHYAMMYEVQAKWYQ